MVPFLAHPVDIVCFIGLQGTAAPEKWLDGLKCMNMNSLFKNSSQLLDYYNIMEIILESLIIMSQTIVEKRVSKFISSNRK